MSEDRAFDPPEQAIADLAGEFADFKATMLARTPRGSVGDVEFALRATPKPGTIFLQGQTLNRADYPDLWAWAEASGSVVAGLYGAGNGTTTFVVPDARDRVLVGAGGTVTLGGTGGSATRTLTVANLPVHDHDVAVANHATHDHNVSVANHAGHFHPINSDTGLGGGNHGNHTSGAANVVPPGSGVTLPSNYSVGNAAHSHPIDTDTGTVGLSAHSVNESAGGPTTHSVTQSGAGTGTAFDNRPPFLGTNYAVWT